MYRDLRLALRGFAKAPAFATAVIAVLALGIGATTLIFSIAYGVLLKPLPFADASHIVAIETVASGQPDDSAYPDVQDWRAHSRTLDRVGPYTSNAMTLTGRGDTVGLPVALVGGDFFDIFGVAPLRGRLLRAADDAKGAAAVAVISESLWRSRFGADDAIVGQNATLDSTPFTIVGVMPASFEFPYDSDRIEAWVPIHAQRFAAQIAEQRGASFLSTVAHVRPGRSLAEVRAELGTIEGRLHSQYPDTNRRRTDVRVTPLQHALVRDYQLALVVLLAAVGVVLLIACANVANLLLARGTGRRREMAIRTALGAARRRLVRQLLTESVLLSVLGGLAALMFCEWGLGALLAASPIEIPRLHSVRIDGVVLLFAFGASLLTGLLFGLVPALQLSSASTADALKEEGRGSAGRSGRRTRRVLVVAEMALSVVLLVSAGLLLHSLAKLQRVNPGFVPDRAVGMFMSLSQTQYPKGPSQIAFTRRLLAQVRTLPGIESAALASTLPLSGSDIGMGFAIEGRPPDPGVRPAATAFAVSADYFRTMGIPVVRGRAFTARDNETAPPVAIVNETFARRYWPNEDPVGKRIRVNYNDQAPREIVGVVGDVKTRTLSEQPDLELYTTFEQTPWPFVAVVVRTGRDLAETGRELRTTLARVDPAQAAVDVKPLQEYVEKTVAAPRFTAALTGAFAALALLLAAVGLYGVITYSVAQRQREIGIRLALGARPSAVRGLVVSEAAWLGAIGLALGLAGAFAAAHLLGTLLFGVSAADPITFAGVSALLALVLIAAAYFPARRATHIDPVVALRAE